MEYETILVEKILGGITVKFNRLERQNTINVALIKELNHVLSIAQEDSDCRVVVLEGQQGVFCTGMDFSEVAKGGSDEFSTSGYMETIKGFASSPKVIISSVDGRVMAGGVGIVAASDLVIATPRSQFSLSEILWGLLPACVIPYLIRRVGFQKAYSMTLTTQPISAKEAHASHLVDEISETPEDNIRKLLLRLRRLEESDIANMKRYFRKMWMIDEEMEETAVAEISRLVSAPKVTENIRNFVEHQKFPWENK